MPHQYVNHVINQSTKRRMHEDDEEEDRMIPLTKPDQGSKRLNDLSQEFNPNNGPPKPEITLPSLTYASPDYRPPPRADALWLQPVPQVAPPPPTSATSQQQSTQPPTPLDTAQMEEDSTDEDNDILLPTTTTNAFLHQHPNSATTKQTAGFDWIMADQC